jgi:pimeloyl-ACP methyl ester carboxylesterase
MFSHGWPPSSDVWDGQIHFITQNGFRVVAHDRRGHGRSSQPSSGNDMDGYADDLAAVIEELDLNDTTLVGHSTGGGEVARYIGRHGTKRVAKAVLIAAAVPPVMLKSQANSEGLPIEAFDNLRSSILKDRSQFYKDLRYPFTAPTDKVPRCHMVFWISSGFGACRPASRTPTKASRPSPRPISSATSRRSMSRPWLCMAMMTRSFQSRTLQ